MTGAVIAIAATGWIGIIGLIVWLFHRVITFADGQFERDL